VGFSRLQRPADAGERIGMAEQAKQVMDKNGMICD